MMSGMSTSLNLKIFRNYSKDLPTHAQNKQTQIPKIQTIPWFTVPSEIFKLEDEHSSNVGNYIIIIQGNTLYFKVMNS